MNINNTLKKIFPFVVFILVTVGIFYVMQKKITNNIVYSALISIMISVSLSYFLSTFVADVLESVTDKHKTKYELKGLRANNRRLEEKVQKLTKDLEAANSRLKTELAEKSPDQINLQQRLKNLNCLYALSKIVNRQEATLDQLFQETVCLIRQAYRYPDSICVRMTVDGIPYQTKNFQKSELSRHVQIRAHEENVGVIEVYHQDIKTETSEYCLLIEDQDSLLNAVAEWIGSITERKKAEEKMELFRNLIERSNDFIFAVEPKWGRFMNVNNRACESLGYTPKEFLSEITFKNIDISISDDYSWTKQIEQLKKKGDIVKEAQYQRKDGTKFFVETSLKFVTQEKEDYIIAIARDITERKRSEEKLKTAQDKLLETARKVGMAEVATGVLHNVGNVLNSVSVTADSIQKRIRKSKISYLGDAVNLFEQHSNDLVSFLTSEERGKKIPLFLANLSQELIEEQNRCLESLDELTRHVQHMADIVQLQQSYSKIKGIIEPTNVSELIDDAIKINAETISRNNIKVKRDYEDLPVILLDRHKILQILTNLISNSVYALRQGSLDKKEIDIRLKESKKGFVKIEISDNGIGIPKENLTRIFEHGFTTKKKGHGFGLHSAALAINELNGSINVTSDGPDKGAVFIIELPFKTQEAAA